MNRMGFTHSTDTVILADFQHRVRKPYSSFTARIVHAAKIKPVEE